MLTHYKYGARENPTDGNNTYFQNSLERLGVEIIVSVDEKYIDVKP
jgi:hypothetical protein